MDFKALYTPEDESEFLSIKVLFDSEHVRYSVEGENIGAVFPGPQISSFNARRIFVWEEDFDRAAALLKAHVQKKDRPGRGLRLSLFDRVFMAFQAVLLVWFAPGSVKAALGRRKQRKAARKASDTARKVGQSGPSS